MIGERTARAKARRQQWKLVSGTMLIHCLLQVLSIALILHVFRTDARFESKGSHLGKRPIHIYPFFFPSRSQLFRPFIQFRSRLSRCLSHTSSSFDVHGSCSSYVSYSFYMLHHSPLSLFHELTQAQARANLGQQASPHSNHVITAVPVPDELSLSPRVPMSRHTRLLLLVRYGPSRKLVNRMKARGCWTDMKRVWRVVGAKERPIPFDVNDKENVEWEGQRPCLESKIMVRK